MQRIDSKYAVSKLPEPGKAETDPGYFTGGNAEAETPGTVISVDWLNMVQEELMAVVEDTGQTPDKKKLKQLLAGIKKLIDEDPKSNSAVNAAQAAAKVADEAAQASKQAASSSDSAVKTAENAEGISMAAEIKAASAVKTANNAEGISRAAEAKADSALTHTGQNTGTFWINDEPLDANNFFSNAVNYYLTNAENQNLPIAAPLYFKVEINADPVDVGSPTSVIQTAWNDAASVWRRMGTVSKDHQENPVASWGDWQEISTNSGASGTPLQIMHVQDVKEPKEGGGTAIAESWHTRDLNTVLTNTIPGASLSSNRIILPAGTYLISGRAPGCDVSGFQARLFSITNSKTLLVGSSAFASPGMFDVGTITYSCIEGVLTLTTETQVELQQFVCKTVAGVGLGMFVADYENILTTIFSDENNIYSEILIKRLS